MRSPLIPRLFERVPDDPFYQPRRPLWLPPEMVEPPAWPQAGGPRRIEPRRALLLSPFYPKDPHGSYAKHVLTPSLALTSLAAATPPHWRVDYWDENLLQGVPRLEVLPEVVGITVHLTFAGRAYELARWFRDRGSKVVLGGLHVQSCPEEAAPHADAIAIGDGVQLWPEILGDIERGALRPRYAASYDRDFNLDPSAAPRTRAPLELPDDDQPDRHAGMPQPVLILLLVQRRPPNSVSRARGRRGPPGDRNKRPAVCRVRRQQPRRQA